MVVSILFLYSGCEQVAKRCKLIIFATKLLNYGTDSITVRMDSEVKRQFDELCKDFGMSANTAFNIFARTVIKQERIPFEVESERQAALERARATI